MICQKCGYRNSNEASFCEKCGTPLKQTVQTTKENNNSLYIAIIAIFIVIGIIGAGAIIAFSGNNSNIGGSSEVTELASYDKGFPVSRAPDLASAILSSGDFQTISFDSVQLTKYQCLYILSKSITMISSAQDGNIPIKSFSSAPNPYGRIHSGTIAKSNYLDMAQRTGTWFDNNGIAPNYVGIYTPGANDVSPSTMLRILAKALVEYKSTGQLPSTVSF
ncbi:zinc-ribbon domain-containing protein [Methanobrevibacter sp. DSM 116169]|uniref:zinc-ribbon domain-containing protein n=1 Tax=Methanobrevibacter sp. DSM 116169 TaxID=3242727 RepID=UPI0038FD3AC6